MDKNVLKTIAKAFGFNVVINEGDDDEADTAILSPIESEEEKPAPELEGVNMGDVKATLLLAKNALDEVKALREQLGGEEGVKTLVTTLNDAKMVLTSIMADQEKKRAGLVAQLVANSSVFSEAELKVKPVAELEKLVLLSGLPEVDYSLAAAGTVQNSETLAIPPAVLLAPRTQARQ